MTAFDKWWAEMVQRRPELLNDGAKFTMTVEQLKANLKRAYDAGWAKAGKEISGNPLNPWEGLFKR